MEIHSLPPEKLIRFIERIRKFEVEKYESYLHSLFMNALSELNEFIPCEGAFILMDDPAGKKGPHESDLVYIAAYGPNSQSLIGKKIPTTGGIVGETYVLGKSMVRKADLKEKLIVDKINFPHQMNTMVSVPLKIENAVVGALLVFNKKDPVGFTIRDLKLVEIFAGYIATSVQNAIDARKSHELSKRDDLTGLYNDRYFHKQLETEVRQSEEGRYPLCLLFLDLDNFKSINDQHGHLIGSQTLKEIGFILRDAVSDRRATIARYGGDEYVLVLPGIDLDGAMDIAELIRKMIVSKMFMIDRGESDGSFVSFKGIISCSSGISSLQDHVPSGGSPRDRKNQLIRMADEAMYHAKELGKNRVCVALPPHAPTGGK